MIEEIRAFKDLPSSWKESTITLIPKPGQSKSDIKNYRPISLLNVDYKIFATILATKLKSILSEIIHQDQSGFLPRRQIKNNTRMLINILEYYENYPEKQVALIFFDAQKAFDNVYWQFMIEQLKATVGEEEFVGMIETVYSTQEARILVNGELTKKIDIKKVHNRVAPSLLYFLYSRWRS